MSYYFAMQRILIIGTPGAGKSTLAITLGRLLNLPVRHLDRYFWKPGWIQTERQMWREWVEKLVSEKSWIIDGTYRSTFDIRFPRADTIIFLDYDVPLCLWRVLKRVVKNHGSRRPDMAEGCPERLDIEFIKFIIKFRADVRPAILENLQKYFKSGNLLVARNDCQLASLIRTIAENVGQPGMKSDVAEE
jgi:adenylate kinase family enzyme